MRAWGRCPHPPPEEGSATKGSNLEYFAVADNRITKAQKIAAVLCDYLGESALKGRDILDLGCGSGHIAGFFAIDNAVVLADVVDQRSAAPDAPFALLEPGAPELPFDDGAFDVVIYNHVVCCVADPAAQLREIRRVLKKDGVCYFASANRNFPVEGFTKLALLHYLPQAVFRKLYQKIRKTDIELHLLTRGEMLALFEETGFRWREYTAEIVRNPGRYHSEYRIPSLVPVPRRLSPTVIAVLAR